MWRKLPHLNYKNYGGAYNKCDKEICPAPADELDAAFQIHDNDLQLAKTKEHRRLADARLYRHMKDIKPKNLGLYGKLYRLGALAVFGISSGSFKRQGLGFKWTKKF